MEMIQQLLSVFLVLGLLGAMLWWLRRKGMGRFSNPLLRTRAGRRLEHLERLPLGAQHSLHLVRVADQSILLAVSPTGCQLIATPSPIPLPEPAPEAAR